MSFMVFILTHGRPDKVYTYETLKRSGYSGPIKLIVDNEDSKIEEYKKAYPNQIEVFDKKAASKITDIGDNFPHRRGVVYARNYLFEIAKKLKVKSFLELDDDYTSFQFRFDNKLNYNYTKLTNLDGIFKSFINFLEKTNFITICWSQGGDFIGGENCDFAQKIKLKRKAMNSFFCLTSRPFKFFGRLNEDVTMYCNLGSKGYLVGTTNQISLQQKQTQTNAGGLTELYLDSGTYVKSFYSVLYNPSSIKVAILKDRERARLHHSVNWNLTVPKILSEDHKKQ